MDENNNQNGQAPMPKEPTKKEKAAQAGKDVAELGAKAAGTYFGGPAGGAIVDKVAQTKAGQKVLNTAGKALSKNPVTRNVLAKAQPGIEKAKPALNAAVGSLGGNPAGAASGASSGANAASNASKANPLNSNPSSASSSSSGSQTNNSGFGNNKSGLFSNSSKSSGGNGNSNSSSASGDFVKTMKKAKMVMAIAGPLISFLLPIFFIIIIAVIIMAQVMTVRDSIAQLAQQFTTGVEKLINFAQGGGWMTNEDEFFNYLDKEYNRFSASSAGAQLDIPLIAATIHYSKTSDLDKFEESQEGDSEDYTSDDFENLGGTISKDQTVSFYKVAKDKLGSTRTLFPGQKRLLGHVSKSRATVVWVDVDVSLGYWGKLGKYFEQQILSTAGDAYWKTPLKFTSPLGFINTFNEMSAYAEQNKDAFAGMKYDAANLYYEVQELLYTFEQAYHDVFGTYNNDSQTQEGTDSSSLSNEQISDTDKYVPEEDRNGLLRVPVPLIVSETNYGYDEYKQMKKDMLEMSAMLSKNGIETSTRQETLDKAKNSNNDEIKKLYNSYKKNELNYKYSYTHYLQNVYVPFTYFYNQEYTLSEIDNIVEEIFEQRDFYNYLVGEDFNYSCGGSCIYPVGGQEINNLKVKLLQCIDGNRGEPIPGEQLVDFEKYILGVVYAEIGPDAPTEAAKVQAIAARSFALTRPKQMGNAAGIKLEKENGNWILAIRNCTEDQVYCDPDKGCSNTTNPSSSGNSTTVYSGATTKPHTYKGPLAEDASIRSAVSAVTGQVLLDSTGDIVVTGYLNTNQQNWISQAKQGMDYTEILMTEYEKGDRVSTSTCSKVCNGATGDYTQWKQLKSLGAPWADIIIGNGETINNVGCLVTSVAMQIARSGVPLTIPELNPGTFVEGIKPEGFIGANFVWASTTKVAPTFVHQGSYSLSGQTQAAKASKIQSLINDGCYLVMEVKGNGGGQHWVAVDYVQGSTVYMMDPASTNTVAWDQYPHTWTTQVNCFKVTG